MSLDEDLVMGINEDLVAPTTLRVELKGGDHVISGKTETDLADGETLIIGRSMDADVWLFDGQASRQHACLSANENNGKLELTLMDMRSSNGTRVNGNPANLPIVLRSGDVISIGAMEIEVVIG